MRSKQPKTIPRSFITALHTFWTGFGSVKGSSLTCTDAARQSILPAERGIFPLLIVLVGVFAGAAGCAVAQVQARVTRAGVVGSLAGVWQDPVNPDFFLEIAGTQILIAAGGRIREAAAVLAPTEGGLLVCQEGHEVSLALRRIGEVVEFLHAREGRARRLVRTSTRPDALALSLKLPDPSPLQDSEILAIQREIRLRYQDDQSSFRQRVRDPMPWLRESGSVTVPSSKPEGVDFRSVERSGINAEYIRNLILEIGWLDAKRFGYPTSTNAFVLVQHSWDPSLMLSVLPRVKQDVDAGLMAGESYALLYDRAQLALGWPQRFGSQVVRSSSGEWIVLPLEDPEEVDARRKEWGLQPLKDYVGLFGAPAVKLSAECSALTTPSHQSSEPH
ncbi:MAG TPA: DUF6624 domain-containing protein [Thermoanaerobaculia bacterium]|nr:DUF6624 domain-containing protein [Thermoanaerobaculia bacterium]